MSTARLLPELLVVQTGTAARDLVAKHGDYPDWFEGALGAKLRIVIYDDAARPAQATNALRKLAGDDKVLAVAGPLTSSTCTATAVE